MYYSRLMVYAYAPNFVWIVWRRKPLILPFVGLRHLVMSTVGNTPRKLNTGAQLQIFPYPMASKSFLYSQRLHGENWRTNSNVQKRDEQIDKQKLNVFWPPRLRVKSEPNQTWHSDRGPRARSCTFGGLMHSFAARGR